MKSKAQARRDTVNIVIGTMLYVVMVAPIISIVAAPRWTATVLVALFKLSPFNL